MNLSEAFLNAENRHIMKNNLHFYSTNLFKFSNMSDQEKNPYQLFTKTILLNWKSQHVTYIKVEELTSINNITMYELIPDSELLDGDQETLYPIESEDILDMLLPNPKIRFLVHNVYLADDEE
ncbi:hypothetical protein [Sphingobacterium pedocola]|uniref:Uncharacterized protein n=1 Tax=Sphingobacterium pedocola TaxID=2082722 RepID=A0ABR9T615_9SPHI|nr:hypothetical protein [Sphingobacterium pedocola]MBE8720780.1 hypothetical protein [Sphingobacterium pedocola]